MICLRCGYCCIQHSVVLPDGTFKPSGKQCKHLVWDKDEMPGQATCTIHGQEFEPAPGTLYTWEETPCGRHGQMESSPGDLCRMGAFLVGQGKDGRCMIGKEGSDG